VDAGLDVHGDPIRSDYTFAGGRGAMGRALASGEGFTAVVAANVPSAVGALQALHDAGVAVPAEVSVIAIHDAEIAEIVRPRLTTIQMPLARLGGRAIQLLASMPATAVIDEVVERPMRLVVRDSTGRAASA
jgi:LacI family transcriptional regulator